MGLLSSLWTYKYEVPVTETVDSRSVGVLYRVIQFGILVYGISTIILMKEYQDTCSVESLVSAKLKGAVYTDSIVDMGNDITDNYEAINRIVWDSIDSASSYGGDTAQIFVMTSIAVTENQTRSTCAERETVKNAFCSSDLDCAEKQPSKHGIFTGRCVEAKLPRRSTCEITAWCPLPKDKPSPVIGVEKLNITIKNTIKFTKFGPQYTRRNVPEITRPKTQRKGMCVYDEIEQPFCPTFRVGDIIEKAGENLSHVTEKGGVFSINIKWNCDLDWDFMEQCKPQYTFKRIDNVTDTDGSGWSYKNADYHEKNRRTLNKRYGLLFLIRVTGEARKFDFHTLVFNIGAVMGLLGFATSTCDFIVSMMLEQTHTKSINNNNYHIKKNQDGQLELRHTKKVD